MSKADAEYALMRIEQISQEAREREEKLLAPSKAIELLFGVTEKQMVEAIYASTHATGKYPVVLELPPIGGFKMSFSFRGCKLIVGEKLEAKP